MTYGELAHILLRMPREQLMNDVMIGMLTSGGHEYFKPSSFTPINVEDSDVLDDGHMVLYVNP